MPKVRAAMKTMAALSWYAVELAGEGPDNALVLIVASVLFGFNLGTFFTVAMIALAGGAILYKTSGVMRHYPHDKQVAASLELFACVALLFWYVLQLFMSRR